MITPRATKERKHALAGNGPIVDRARDALHRVALQFGNVIGTTQTSVAVRTTDGIELSLSYDPGNFVFSRVYNLTISTVLPTGSWAPSGVRISHKDRGGPRYIKEGADAATAAVDRLNTAARPHLDGIDVLSSAITTRDGKRIFTMTPLGGSYVWVLIPPVFKATALPPGEPDRILALIRAVRGLEAATAKNERQTT